VSNPETRKPSLPSGTACSLRHIQAAFGGTPCPGGLFKTYNFPGHDKPLTREQWLSEDLEISSFDLKST